MASVREFVEKKLKLKVNEKKSKVGDPPKVGEALETEVPGTHVHSEQETQDTDSAQGAGEVQGTGQGDNREKPGNQHGQAAEGTQYLPSGMDWVLPAGGHRERHRGSGQLDTKTAPRLHAETVEEIQDQVPQPGHTGSRPRGSPEDSRLPQRILAPLTNPCCERSPQRRLLAPSRASQSRCDVPFVAHYLVNRRVPNGTHGGVGGRGLITPSYPIPGFQRELCWKVARQPSCPTEAVYILTGVQCIGGTKAPRVLEE